MINTEPGGMPTSDPIRVKMTEAKRQKFGALLLERIEKSRKGMKSRLSRMKDWRNFYESSLPEKTFPWADCSNVNVPLTQWHVDTYQAHITKVVLGVTPYTQIRAAEPANRERAKQVQELLRNTEEVRMNLAFVVKDAITESLLAGVCIPKLTWRDDYRTVREVVDDLDESGNVIGQKMQTVHESKYRGPKLEFVDLRNFVIYPLTSPTVDDAILVGDRFYLSKDQLARRTKSGFYDKHYADKVLEKPDSEQSTAQDLENEENLDHAGIETVEEDVYYFWEVITGYDVNNDKLEEECLVTLDATNGTIVRIIEYPYYHGRRNYIPFIPYRRSSSVFGRSLPQLVEHMQRELNTIHNQRSDGTQMALCKPFKILESSDLSMDDIFIAPGVGVKVSDMDEIQEFEIDPVIPGLEIESMTVDYAERATAINDLSLGRGVEGDKTAREVSIVAGEGGIRFADVIQNIQLAMVEIAKQVIGLSYQFMSDTEIAQYSDTREQPLTRDALRMEFDYIPHGTPATANTIQKREEALLLHRELRESPLIMSNLLRLRRLEQDVLTAFDRDDYEAYIGTENEVGQQMQAQAQAAQMQVESEQGERQQEMELKQQAGRQKQGESMQASGEAQAIQEAEQELASAAGRGG